MCSDSLYFLLKSDVAKCSQPSLFTVSNVMDADRREETPLQILFFVVFVSFSLSSFSWFAM